MNKRLCGSIFAASLAVSPFAYSATDGSLGATSEGSFNISLVLTDIIVISGLSDFLNLTYSPGSDVTDTDTHCVYSNASSGTFEVNASSTNEGAGGTFRLVNGANTIEYSFTYNGVAMTSDFTQTSFNNNGGSGFAADATDTDCSTNGFNMSYAISIPEANIQAAPQATYTDTVTILVQPI